MTSPDDKSRLFPDPSSPSAEVVTHIVRLLEAKDWEIRAVSAKELGKRGDLRAVDALCIALTDKIWHVRIAAVGALGHLKDARAVEPLCGSLKDGDWYIRLAAIGVLEQLGDVRAVEPLCALLEDTEAPVRVSAADALGKIGDVWAVEALCFMLQSLTPSVIRAAGQALDRMGTAEALPLRILASPSIPPAKLLSTLQVLGETVVRLPYKTIRYRIGNVQAFCESLCRQSRTEERVRQGAEAVLAEIRNKEAADILLRASARYDGREKSELLRGVSNSAPTPPEELLRAANTDAESPETPRKKPSHWLAKIFKRRL